MIEIVNGIAHQFPLFGLALLMAPLVALMIMWAAANEGLMSTKDFMIGAIIVMISYFVATMD